MSFKEILLEIPRLKPQEREEIQACLNECASECDDECEESLSSEEHAMIEARLEDLKKNPESYISLDEFESRLNARFCV